MTVDNKCWWLASQFVSDTALDPQTTVPKLAAAIQEAIETFLAEKEAEIESNR